MKKFSERFAALTPSITAGVIVFAVGLTALLAYRAFDASRAQQRMSEQTLREYAGFAAYQIKNAASSRITGMQRGAFELILREILAHGPTPSLGPDRAATMMKAKAQQCRCLDGVSFFYQVTFGDSGIESTASQVATSENLRLIRDTVIADARAARQLPPPPPNPRPPGFPTTSQVLTSIISELAERPYAFTYALTLDASGNPVVAYGFAVLAEQPVARAVKAVLESQPVLPNTLTRGLSADSILAVAVTTASGKMLYKNKVHVDTLYSATDSLEQRQGGLRFEVAIDPASADRLILGGLPRSRLTEVLAISFVAITLLVMLLYLFRRQEELARLRDDFVSGVSHELRTPLAQIRLLAELLYMGKVPTDERERSLRIIDKEARRLSFLVDGILSFTHSRLRQLSPVSTDIANEIDEIVSGFAPLAQAQGVRLTTELERGIVANVDRSALRQVLLNLLDNAVRYGPMGQTVTIITKRIGDNWVLQVSDEGPGIPTDERDRIFAPYYRMTRDAGGAVGGTGIGLAVVRRLVAEHSGSVRVESANGDDAKGSRFVVSLPVNSTAVNGR